MNQTFRQCGIQYEVNEELGLATCIISSVFYMIVILQFITDITFVPEVIILLLSVAETFIFIFYCKFVKDGAIALLSQEHQPFANQRPKATARVAQQTPVESVPAVPQQTDKGSCIQIIQCFLGIIILAWLVVKMFLFQR
jgi:hypothetical protein